MYSRHITRLVITSFFLLFLTTGSMFGCASLPFGKNPQSREALENRIRQLWEAKKTGDRETVYKMSDLKFQEESKLSQFLLRRGLAITSYHINGVEISENGLEAKAMVQFDTIVQAHRISPSIKEPWVFEKGEWRVKLSDEKNPFTTNMGK